jgi:hypothetical protein
MNTFRSNTTYARPLSRRASLALGGLALSLALLVGSSSAHAAVIQRFQSLATGYALDSNFNGAVYAGGWNGGNYQRWYVTPSGTYAGRQLVTVTDVATGRCLDSNTSRAVYTLGCNNGSFQKWIEWPSSYGTYVLQDLATLFVLDGNAAGQMYTNDYNGGSYQKWFALNS